MQLEHLIMQNSGNYHSDDEPVCCLLDNGIRCHRPAGNASYNRQVRKKVSQKKLNLMNDCLVRHIYICDYHKTVIQRTTNEDEEPKVDFYQLPLTTLKRYKKHFHIPTDSGANKAQLAEIIQRHFKSIDVEEREEITFFIHAIKTNKNKLDHKNGINSNNI